MNKKNSVVFYFSVWFILAACLVASAEGPTREKVSKAVTALQISLTTNEQQRFGGFQISIGLNTPFGLSERPGRAMSLPENHIFLVVTMDLNDIPDTVAKCGKDIYLLDAGGTKPAGYSWLLSGWAEDDAGSSKTFEEKQTMKFLYVVQKDRVAGSIFHFLGIDYTIDNYLTK